MSAHALKAETQRRVGKLIDDFAEALISRTEDSPTQIAVRQGTIQGLRLGLEAQSDAYEAIGG